MGRSDIVKHELDHVSRSEYKVFQIICPHVHVFEYQGQDAVRKVVRIHQLFDVVPSGSCVSEDSKFSKVLARFEDRAVDNHCVSFILRPGIDAKVKVDKATEGLCHWLCKCVLGNSCISEKNQFLEGWLVTQKSGQNVRTNDEVLSEIQFQNIQLNLYKNEKHNSYIVPNNMLSYKV